MSIDLVKAIKSPWQKDGGIARMILGGLVLAIPILWFVSLGYLIEYINKIINGNEELGNVFKHGSRSFVIGFKYFVGLILLLIPFLIIDFIFNMIMADRHPVIYWCLFNLLQIIFMVISFMMTINFALDYKVLSMVDFQRALLLIKGNVLQFIIAFIFNSLVQVVYMIPLIILVFIVCALAVAVAVVPLISIILILLMIITAIALIFASLIASYNVMGQFAKESPAIEQMKQMASI